MARATRFVHYWPVVVRLGFAGLYPFLVQLGLSSGWPRLTAGLLAAALLGLGLLTPALSQAGTGDTKRTATMKALPFGLAALLLAVLALALGQTNLLLYLPVLSNLAFLWLFASSLFRGVPLVETFARLWEADLSEEKVRYCRAVTLLWSGFFVVSGAVAWALAQRGELVWWSLYTGVIAHLCAALLGATELLVRVKRFGTASAGPLRGLFERSRAVSAPHDVDGAHPLELSAKDPRDAA